MRKSQFGGILLLLLSLFFFYSCKKNPIIQQGGAVTFSVDTMLFDTVFTAQGSSTRSLKIYNPQKDKIHLSSVRLAGGANSPFFLNINGTQGKEVKDIDIAGHDSIWVFMAVNVDPTNVNNPFLIEDSLIATLNGQNFTLPVIAFGQNAHYVVDSVLSTQTWTADKPYVIVHNALVDQNATLTLQAGTRVYMHQDSRLFVQGTLKINGTQQDSVIFQGDRIDRLIYVGDYEDVPGEWGGLYFFPESHDNVINYTVFKNGGASTNLLGQTVLGATIQINKDSLQTGQPVLRITNSKIHDSQGYGIVAFNSSLYAANCLIVRCGAENLMLFQGGNYKVYDCTMATYSSSFISHDKNVTMGVLNYYPLTQTTYDGANLSLDMKGCIIYGSLDNELVVDKKDDFQANVSVDHCLIKSADGIPNFVTGNQNIFNQDPMFVAKDSLNFQVMSGSPVIGQGVVIPGINTDITGKIRSGSPTIGCYEF